MNDKLQSQAIVFLRALILLWILSYMVVVLLKSPLLTVANYRIFLIKIKVNFTNGIVIEIFFYSISTQSKHLTGSLTQPVACSEKLR